MSLTRVLVSANLLRAPGLFSVFRVRTAIHRLPLLWTSDPSNEIRSKIFPDFSRVNTTVQLHHVNFKEHFCEKT